ncbi:cysteine hydrolase, partial [Streptomyces albiflaviniger]|nr:cysteine hydrolase [Streptomyces albiflaviniger]
MPATALDPNTALVLVDLQKGITGLPTVHPTAEVVERGAQLAA